MNYVFKCTKKDLTSDLLLLSLWFHEADRRIFTLKYSMFIHRM